MFKTDPYRVYMYDTDAAGVVHHSQYIRYLEAGRIEYLRWLGIPYLTFQEQGIGFVPTTLTIQYRKPLRQDDAYCVTVAVESYKRASFTLRQTIVCNDVCCVMATVTLACVTEPDFTPIRLPERLLQVLATSSKTVI
jgi:acyl-CoA thioester hydrolase